jgi:transposase
VRRITQWHVGRLHAEFKRSGSIARAAEYAKVSLPTAYRHLGAFAKELGYRAPVQREALRLYASGLSTKGVAAALAEKYNPSPSRQTVWDWVRSAGIVRSKGRAQEIRACTENRRDYAALRRQVRELAEEKLWSVRAIARHLGVSRNFVKCWIPREYRCELSTSIERRAWQAYHPDVERRRTLFDQVVALRERGRKLEDIVVETGLSRSTVWVWCKRAGLTKPTTRRAA